ncbi:MAG: redoxin domain-containing protein [Cyclobacteriaceae bacterium]
MNRLWLVLIVGGLAIGCGRSTEKKEVQQAGVLEVEEEIAEKEVVKTYDAALEEYGYYEDQIRRIAYKNDKTVIQAYLDSALTAIEGSIIGDYTFVDVQDRVIKTTQLDKPLYLMTSASWCKPCISKIPAFNKAVEEYQDRVNFAVLFYDDSAKVQKMASDYNESIYLVPSWRKRQSGDMDINIGGFRHITSYPTSYLINPEMTIMKLSQGGYSADTILTDDFKEIIVTPKQSFARNYQSILSDIGVLLGESIIVDVEEETQVHQKDYSSIKL